jgi:ribosomal protein L17
MFRQMLGSLIKHERLVTTHRKAVELSRIADRVLDAACT